ncbi:MAG TPA: protein phosphatase 2C domain-containing protein [Puia sp.]|jgi:hypothetical protein
MDGCTMGTDRYFASALVGKLLKKIAKAKGYKELYGAEPEASNPEAYLKSILKDLFQELLAIKGQLILEQNEPLTTFLILLIDKKQGNGIALVVGDGVVAVNGEITEFDQDNKPDYLGFHLHEDFDTWYAKQTQKIYIYTVQDVSIATDGITFFTKTAASKAEDVVDSISFLPQNLENRDKDDMLD